MVMNESTIAGRGRRPPAGDLAGHFRRYCIVQAGDPAADSLSRDALPDDRLQRVPMKGDHWACEVISLPRASQIAQTDDAVDRPTAHGRALGVHISISKQRER